MPEPASLVSVLAEQLKHHQPGTRGHDIRQQLLLAVRADAHRRAAVLKHEDLRGRLCQPPIGYDKAGQWNGYVPPAYVNQDSTEELCSSARMGMSGRMDRRYGQLGHYGTGQLPNDSPRRAALAQLSQEAWDRDQAAGTVEACAATTSDGTSCSAT